MKTQDGVKPNYAYFPIVFDGYKFTRDEIDERLRENDIIARKYFYPITNSFDCYDYDVNETPIALDISKKVLTVPMYAGLTVEEVDKICDIILGE